MATKERGQRPGQMRSLPDDLRNALERANWATAWLLRIGMGLRAKGKNARDQTALEIISYKRPVSEVLAMLEKAGHTSRDAVLLLMNGSERTAIVEALGTFAKIPESNAKELLAAADDEAGKVLLKNVRLKPKALGYLTGIKKRDKAGNVRIIALESKVYEECREGKKIVEACGYDYDGDFKHWHAHDDLGGALVKLQKGERGPFGLSSKDELMAMRKAIRHEASEMAASREQHNPLSPRRPPTGRPDGPDETMHLFWSKGNFFTLSKQQWKLAKALWNRGPRPFHELGQEIWNDEDTPWGTIKTLARRLGEQLLEIDHTLSVRVHDESVILDSDNVVSN
jgi:hypothetical protein